MKYNEIDKVKSIEQAGELFEHVAWSNKKKFTLVKAAEELNELSLVLLQIANKKGSYKPTKQEVIDEIGDVIIRIDMIKDRLKISEKDIEERILYKANKFLGYLKENLYVKGI